MAEKKKVLPHKCDACGKGWDCGGCGDKVSSVRCPECQDKMVGVGTVKPKFYYGEPPQTLTASQLNATAQAFQWGNQPQQQEWITAPIGQLFTAGSGIFGGNQ